MQIVQRLRRVLNPDFEKNPAAILQVIVRVACVSIALILSLSGVAVYTIISSDITKDAMGTAVKVSKALFEEHRGVLVQIGNDGTPRLYLDQANIPAVDRNIWNHLHSFDILKAKIYNSQKQIIYSNDSKIIGEVDSNNHRLDRALNGYVDTHIEKKDRMLDLADEAKFNVEVLETYTPLIIDGTVIGSFEIYTDVTGFRRAIAREVVVTITCLAVILLSVFFLSYLIIRKAVILLKKTKAELAEKSMLFQTLSDFASDWIFWRTPEGKTIYVSPACEAITGYSPSEFMNDPGLEECLLHPDDQPLWNEYIGAANKSGATLDYKRIEVRVLARNGDYRWISHASKPIYDNSGSFVGLRGSNIDITEKKEAERVIADKVVELEAALANVKQLEGLIPICSYCKQIRDDKNAWHHLENYISSHSGARFSHGICPECYKKQVLEIKTMVI